MRGGRQRRAGSRGGIGGDLDGHGGMTVHIQVADPVTYLKRVEVGGGMVLVPTTTIAEGVTIALFADPAGDTVGLLKAM